MSEPTKPAPFAGAYIVNGQNVCAHSTARCEPCQFGQCPGGNHSWAGPEDIAHAKATGQPNPSDEKCGCHCTEGPVIAYPEPDWETFGDYQPCPICGELSACGYDPEGRPLIHTDVFAEETTEYTEQPT